MHLLLNPILPPCPLVMMMLIMMMMTMLLLKSLSINLDPVVGVGFDV